MIQRTACKLATGLALAALLVTGPTGMSDQGQSNPPSKDAGKQANPLQALQDAFAKGVSVKEVDPKDLPKEITEGANKNAPGAAVKKAKKQEIRHTMKYVALDQPKVQSYQATMVKDDKRVRVQLAPDGKQVRVQAVAEKK